MIFKKNSKAETTATTKKPRFWQKKNHKTETEKLAERREEVLATGRKFKYPLQFAKYRLVWITVILVVLALAGSGLGIYYTLYQAQDTSDVFYRLTTVLPLPVAKIDGSFVRFSDYLLLFRSSITPLEQQNGTISADEDAGGVAAYYKSSALTSAEDYTYALKLANELNLSVSDSEIDEVFLRHQNTGGTERSRESFLKIIKDNFGLSESEYRRMLYLSLIKEKVEIEIDTAALSTINKIADELSGVTDSETWVSIAKKYDATFDETGGLVDLKNVDGGRAETAAKLDPNELSDVFVSANGDGYYLVLLLEKTDTEVSYYSIGVEFTEFDQRVDALRAEGKVEEFIEIILDDTVTTE